MSKNNVVLTGFHAVGARLRTNPDSIKCVYADPARKDKRMKELLEKLRKANLRVMEADQKRLEGFAGDLPNQGIVALAEPLEAAMSFDDLMNGLNEKTFLLILDGVTDPRNFGACLRVADAAGVTGVIVPKDRSAALSPAAIRASAGASENVPLVQVTNLAASIVELVDAGIPVVGTAGEAEKTIYDFDQKGAFAWVLGAEGDGLRQLTRKRCSDLAKIPMFGAVESLNVSVAAGICLYETVRQRLSK